MILQSQHGGSFQLGGSFPISSYIYQGRILLLFLLLSLLFITQVFISLVTLFELGTSLGLGGGT